MKYFTNQILQTFKKVGKLKKNKKKPKIIKNKKEQST